MLFSESIENIPKLQNANLKDKVVLVRVDHNVAQHKGHLDPFRIDITFGTLFNILSQGGKLILMTHFGRPRDKKNGEIDMSPEFSVDPIVDYLERKLYTKFIVPDFKADKDKGGYIGLDTSINLLIKKLKKGKIRGIYLPNIRWFRGEQEKGIESEKLGEQLAGLADVYVNDAFGAWRSHTSTSKIPDHLPSYAGFLMQQEMRNLERIFNAPKPMIAAIAGSKFDTKVGTLKSLLRKVDHLILGGVIYNAYLAAKYDLKIKAVPQEDLEIAKKFVKFSERYPDKIVELPYIVESDTLDGKFDGKYRVHDIRKLKPGTKLNYIVDISEKSYQDKKIKSIMGRAHTIFVNAVMGLMPYFTEGTYNLYKMVDDNIRAQKLFAGGDTLQEFRIQLPGTYMRAIDSADYYFFSGGGSVLKAIDTGSIAGISPIKALIRNSKMMKFNT